MNFGTVRVRFDLTRVIHLIILGLALVHSPANAQEFQFQSTGARLGFPGESPANGFLQVEAFLNYNLWRWDLGCNWNLQSRIDPSAGWLGKRNHDAFIGSIGASLELSRAT